MGKSAPKEGTTQDRQRIQAGLIEPRAGPASASDDPRQEASNQSLTAGRTCAYRSVSRGAIIEDNRSSTALELAIIHWMAHSPLLYYSTALFLAATRPRIGMAGFEPAISCSRSTSHIAKKGNVILLKIMLCAASFRCHSIPGIIRISLVFR